MGASSKAMLKNLRWTSIFLGVSNIVVVFLALILVLIGYQSCSITDLLSIGMPMGMSALRIMALIRCGIEQQNTAMAMIGSFPEISFVNDDIVRRQRKVRYRRWVWWTRFATTVTILQFFVAIYVIYTVAKSTHDGTPKTCIIGSFPVTVKWKRNLLLSFLIMLCSVPLLQCFTSSDVLRWRSFYATHDDVWKAHYEEVFDHGIREALCCVGRLKYLTAVEEDEVHSVARLLGDLVTYRASGTGHLELLAGVALLQRQSQSQSPELDEGFGDAPEDKIHEAAAFHPFAEAAYTVWGTDLIAPSVAVLPPNFKMCHILQGPLLDVGRNPILFPCAWLYRQGILTAWSWKRRPVLHGDNWWRGHAAAFLKYVKLSPGALRRGRVNQGKCQAAYFVVVLHHMRSVVITVRGTETPEDLITDGLCRESSLTIEDLDGLVNCSHISSSTRQHVLSSFPHYGHSGIIVTARELYKQIDGGTEDGTDATTLESCGFLSSLLGVGCECEGYDLRIVGHSLGGAIAAVLALRLYRRYPNLHVYAYGPLPCVDPVIADACSSFITCIVHDSEFSSFLSVNSILRLRAASLAAVSQDMNDATMIYKLARQFLQVSRYQNNDMENPPPVSQCFSGDLASSEERNDTHENRYVIGNTCTSSLWEELHPRDCEKESVGDDLEDCFTNPFTADTNSMDNPVSQFMEVVPSLEKPVGNPPELFLPGLVIHILRQQRGINLSPWEGRKGQEKIPKYRAILANRENFKDILVSPYMFLDHLPWRCHYALKKVLESRNMQVKSDECQMI